MKMKWNRIIFKKAKRNVDEGFTEDCYTHNKFKVDDLKTKIQWKLKSWNSLSVQIGSYFI